MNPLRIGLIGYGAIGRVHAMAYRDLPFHYGLPADRIVVAGVATRREETARQAAAELGGVPWTTDYRELLARPDVDLVDICTPNNAHAEIVLAAAAAGKHVYCEKPLAMTVAEGQRMVDAVTRAGVNSQMTFNFRFFPAILRARQLVEAGFLGRVFSFRGRYDRSSYVDLSKTMTWKLRKETAGAGALFDIASHVLDLIYFLLGDFAAVNATLDTRVAERPLAGNPAQTEVVTVDDLAWLHLRLADGTPGTVEASRLATGATNDLQIEIYGERGALRFNAADPSWLDVYDMRDPSQPLSGLRGFRRVETVQNYPGQKAPDWSTTPSFVRSHAECQYQFLKALWDGRPASPSLADGLKIQAVLEAAQTSASAGRWMPVQREVS
jgi:predicted dehydrogenase